MRVGGGEQNRGEERESIPGRRRSHERVDQERDQEMLTEAEQVVGGGIHVEHVHAQPQVRVEQEPDGIAELRPHGVGEGRLVSNPPEHPEVVGPEVGSPDPEVGREDGAAD